LFPSQNSDASVGGNRKHFEHNLNNLFVHVAHTLCNFMHGTKPFCDALFF